jgi:hypothetical protein
MKYTLLFVTALLANIFLSCYNSDKKNEAEPYPTYDTTSQMETINDTVTHDQGGRTAGDYK